MNGCAGGTCGDVAPRLRRRPAGAGQTGHRRPGGVRPRAEPPPRRARVPGGHRDQDGSRTSRRPRPPETASGCGGSPSAATDFVRKEDMHDHLGEFVGRFLADPRVARRRYDAVLTHYWDAGWAGQRIAEELRLPHIHTPHSLGSWKRRDMARSEDDLSIYRFEERISKEFLVYRLCDHLVATTYQQVELLVDDYEVPRVPGDDDPSGHRRVGVHPGAHGRGQAGSATAWVSGPHDVYAVGRAAANKGYDLLIRCLPELRRLVPDARLQLAVDADSARDRRLVARWSKIAAEAGGDRLGPLAGLCPRRRHGGPLPGGAGVRPAVALRAVRDDRGGGDGVRDTGGGDGPRRSPGASPVRGRRPVGGSQAARRVRHRCSACRCGTSGSGRPCRSRDPAPPGPSSGGAASPSGPPRSWSGFGDEHARRRERRSTRPRPVRRARLGRATPGRARPGRSGSRPRRRTR